MIITRDHLFRAPLEIIPFIESDSPVMGILYKIRLREELMFEDMFTCYVLSFVTLSSFSNLRSKKSK